MKRKIIYWGRVMAQTDIGDGWINAKIRPRWYWTYRRLCLFAGIVWRRWDAQCTRLDWRTAWSVSDCHGFIGPMVVNEGSAADGATIG
jgi:hypothetical protein